MDFAKTFSIKMFVLFSGGMLGKNIAPFYELLTAPMIKVRGKASELVPCSLLPHWNSVRFFVTGSLYNLNSMDKVKFVTLYR